MLRDFLSSVIVVVGLTGASALADAPLVHCQSSANGEHGGTYTYLVDAVSYPMLEFCVGTNDPDRERYSNVVVPPGWHFAVEPVGMAHAHGIYTPNGEVSPGPCYCLTTARVRWWTDDPAASVEYFSFSFDHPWAAEDVGWHLRCFRAEPPEYFGFFEFWDALVGIGCGPLHGPYAPGTYCWSNAECPEDMYCYFEDCAAETGICLPRPPQCPWLWDPVCGCDGVTYANACTAAANGVSVDDQGVCEGQYCWSNAECAEDMYCFFEDCAAETGVCTPRPTQCPWLWDPVCGCDGVTYANACTAAANGMSIAHYGACNGNWCWSNEECGPHSYCRYEDCAAETGVCTPRPEACLQVWDPVCGCDGVTYANACFAALAGVSVAYPGPCQAADVTLDGLVSVDDWHMFADCMAGPGAALPWACAPCDMDLDDDSDVRDVAAFQREYAAAGPPYLGSSVTGGCEMPGRGYDYWCPPDSFELTVEGHTLHVVHHDVTYNCCLVTIAYSLEVEGRELHLYETEITPQPCPCLCCYAPEVTVVELQPGPYTVVVHWLDSDSGTAETYEEEIWVP